MENRNQVVLGRLAREKEAERRPKALFLIFFKGNFDTVDPV